MATRPAQPRTGKRGGRQWLIILVLILAYFALDVVPSLPHDQRRDFGAFMTSDTAWRCLPGHGDGSPS